MPAPADGGVEERIPGTLRQARIQGTPLALYIIAVIQSNISTDFMTPILGYFHTPFPAAPESTTTSTTAAATTTTGSPPEPDTTDPIPAAVDPATTILNNHESNRSESTKTGPAQLVKGIHTLPSIREDLTPRSSGSASSSAWRPMLESSLPLKSF